MLINNAVITGSFIVNGVDVTGITGSSAISSSFLAVSASYVITSASYASTSASLSIRTSNLEATSSTLVSASSSFAASSASVSVRVTNLEATSSVVSSSFAATSGSLSTRITNLESTSSVVSSSFATTSGSISGRVTLIEGQYATTGSNTFTGPQYVNQASNAIGFTSTASLYTDGGLRVAKDSFVSGTAYFNNITVYGTSSIQYITSSQVNIGSNIITVNTDTPAIRFGGLSVFDSGSTELTGSLFWDSEKNHWIYSNPSGSSYNSAMLMNGPRNTGSLGDEQGTTNNALMKGQGGDHITSSQMIDDGTTVRIPGNLQVTGSTILANTAFTGSINVSGSFVVTTTAPELTVGATGVTLGNVLTDIHQVTGSLRVTGSGASYFLGGNVGVGISNNTAKFEIQNSPANDWGLSVWGNTTTGQSYGGIVRGGTNSSDVAFRVNNAANNLTYFTVQGNGNAGIGTTNPNAKLTVWTSSTTGLQTALRLNNPFGFTNANTGAKIVFSQDRTTAEDLPMGEMGVGQETAGTSASGYMFFSTLNSTMGERMRIGSDGTKYFGVYNGSRIQITASGENLYQYTNGFYIYGLFNDANNLSIESAFAGNIIFRAQAQTTSSSPTTATERMRITSGGDVGIGTASPLQTSTNRRVLTVNGTTNCLINLAANNVLGSSWYSSGADYAQFYSVGQLDIITGTANFITLQTNNLERVRITSEGYLGTTVTSTTVSDGDLLGVLSFVSKDSSTYSSGGITNIRSYATSTYNTGNVSGDLRFYVSNGLQNTTGTYLFGTEAMRISNAGDMFINHPTNLGEGKLRVSQDGSLWNVEVRHTYATQYFMLFRYNSSGIGSIVGNGSSVAFNTTSDYRLKEDLKEVNGLNKISAIKVYNYKWKDSDNRMDGVLAHELQEILPYAVTGEKDDLDKDGSIKAQGVDYSKLVPVLVKAIQELSAKVDAQAAEINELKNK